MVNTYLTLDYELFFGKSGSAERSIIYPTNKLISILNKHDAKAVFFVDIGYLIRLKEQMCFEPKLRNDFDKVKEQIQTLANEDHDIQLHIHSHWEDAFIENGDWKFPMKHYRLHSYSEEKIYDIITKYTNALEEISGQQAFAFRAGGWCIQPFDKLRKGLLKANIKIDSTVFKGGKNIHGSHFYNFENAPELDEWFFSKDPCVVDVGGDFKEIPITSYKVSPLFFWKMIYFKKFGGNNHKQFGDGYAVKNDLSQKLRLLFRTTNTVVSIDGYKASYLESAFNRKKKATPNGNFVVIGHPKAFSEYSLNKLDSFLENNKSYMNIKTFMD